MNIKHIFAWAFAIMVLVGAGYVYMDTNDIELTVEDSKTAVKNTYTKEQLEEIPETIIKEKELKGTLDGTGKEVQLTSNKEYQRKDFLELISNTRSCWDNCKTVYKWKNPTQNDIRLTEQTFGIENLQLHKNIAIKEQNMFRLENVSRWETERQLIYKDIENTIYGGKDNKTVMGTETLQVYDSFKDVLVEKITQEEVPVKYGDILKAGQETQLIVKGKIQLGTGVDHVLTYSGIRFFEYEEWYANSIRNYTINISVGDAVDKNVTTFIATINMSNTSVFNASTHGYMATRDANGNLTQIHSEISGWGEQQGQVYFLAQDDYANNTNVFENYTFIVGQLGQPLRNWKYIFADGSNFTGADGWNNRSGNGSEFLLWKTAAADEQSIWVNESYLGYTGVQQESRDGLIDDAGCMESRRNYTLDLIRYDYEIRFKGEFMVADGAGSGDSQWGFNAGNCGASSDSATGDGIYFQQQSNNWNGIAGETQSGGTETLSGAVVDDANVDGGDIYLFDINITSASAATFNTTAITGEVGTSRTITTNIPSTLNARLVFKTWGTGVPDPNMTWDWVYMSIFPQNRSTVLVGGGTAVGETVPPDVTLINPANNLANTSTGHIFRANITDDASIVNATLYTNMSGTWAVNETVSLSGTENFTAFDVTNIPEGNYVWNVLACDGDDFCSWAISNFTFGVDTTAPDLNLTRPFDNEELHVFTVPHNTTFNWTVSDPNLDACWFTNSTANYTVNCLDLNSTNNLGAGNNTLTIFANDTAGNEGSSSRTFLINHLNYSVNYTDTVIEGETYNFTINLTGTLLSTVNGNLTHNGTEYAATVNFNSTEGELIVPVTIPAVSGSGTYNFHWNFTINGVQYNTAIYSQSVTVITPLTVGTSCAAGLSAAMCWDFRTETNLTTLSADEIQYNFKFGISNGTFKTTNGTITNVPNICACVNSTTHNNYTLGYGEIKASDTGFVDRTFYTFNTQRLSNNTINNTLYLLNATLATSFKITVEDTSLNPFIDKYLTLLRWYPGLNTYNNVEMGRTDETGSTVMRVKTEDVDYRIGVYHQNGTLIKLANPIRMVCLQTPCSYTIKVNPRESDYTSFLGVDYSLTFNNNTGIWTFTYSDSTQIENSMNLTIWKDTGTSSYPVCNNVDNGTAGVIVCNTSGTTGRLRGEVYREASPPILLVQKIFNTDRLVFASSWGLWLSMLIAIPIVFLFSIVSPIAAIIGGVVSMIPALYFGAVSMVIVGGLAILGGLVSHFLKRIR